MNPTREEALFALALQKSADRRPAFLDVLCEGDPALRLRLEALLAAPEASVGVLGAEPAREVLAPTVKLPEPVADETVGQTLGRYKLLEKVGEGGCGVVYVAEQTEPVRRRVALKVIKLGMDTREVIARFEAERQALAMMDHPNIARVLDAGTTEAGRPYFVMELVRGIRITDYCDQANISTKERLDLIIKVCQAIQHAHQKGIIHRDIKPSNILVTLHDGVPVPKVIDFGIAKATEGRLTDATVYTQLHQFIGTPAYMSPEQAEMSGLDIDTRSDIYSLGVLLYELLTGTTPFDSKELIDSGLDAMRKTIREKEPVRPSTRLAMEFTAASGGGHAVPASAGRGAAGSPAGPAKAGTPCVPPDPRRLHQLKHLIPLIRGDLDWIVMKCLEKDRSRRYETANGLAADLNRHLTNEPVVARPPSAAYRFQKLIRRNKLAVAAVVAVATVLVLGVIVSTWQASEARRARNAEKNQRLAAEASQKAAELAREAEKEERRRGDVEKATAQRHLYVANMNLAQQAWEQNNIGRLRQLLGETASYPDRGFEWFYWQRQTHLELRTLYGHLDEVRSAAFSTDGHRIVTAGTDGTARVWEAATGKELLTLRGHKATIHCAVFSEDDRRIVTGGWDQTARVWDSTTGKELLVLEGHTAVIHSVALSRDGQRIVTGGEDQTAKVWDATTGKELLSLGGHRERLWSVAISPDSRRIVTGSWDQTAKVWDAATGEELLALNGHTAGIRSVAFAPDGKRIATASEDQTAKVWDAATGQALLTLRGHSGGVFSVSYSPNGRQIVTGSTDGSAKVWEAEMGTDLRTVKGHSQDVWTARFSPDGGRILTGSLDGTVKVWEARLDDDNPSLEGHSAEVASVAFSPNQRWIVTASWDQTAKVWDATTREEVLTLRGHNDRVWSAAFSPDSQRIVTGSWDHTARVWDALTGKELLTLKGHNAGVRCVAFAPDGGRVVTGSEDQTAKVWDATRGTELVTFRGHGGQIWAAAALPDSQEIVTAGGDRTVRLWNAISGAERLVLKVHQGQIWAVAVSADGRYIVTGSADRTAKVWETATGREVLSLAGHGGGIRAVTFTADGHRIVTASEDGTAKVWDAASGKELLTLRGHKGAVRAAAMSLDSQRLLTGGRDHLTRVWAGARPGQIAAWAEQESSAAQQLASLIAEEARQVERERAARSKDSGVIRQWLILAPIPFQGRSGNVALEQEPLEQEGLFHPRAGDRVRIGTRELVWRGVQLDDFVISFNSLLGEPAEFSVAYAVCYIYSEVLRQGLQLKVGSDDQAKIHLNRKQIYNRVHPRPFVADQDVVAGVELNAGKNVLVFKIVNEGSNGQGSIRLTDAAGHPVEGIKVTVDPEAKESR